MTRPRLLTAAQKATYTARYWANEAGLRVLSVAEAARLRFRADAPTRGHLRLVWDRHFKPERRNGRHGPSSA